MLKIVKDSVLRVSRSFGYDIVPLREMKERDFALHLRELLAHLDIDCVLDVGANAGQYRDFLRDKVLYDGPIISFEPVSRHVPGLFIMAATAPLQGALFTFGKLSPGLHRTATKSSTGWPKGFGVCEMLSKKLGTDVSEGP